MQRVPHLRLEPETLPAVRWLKRRLRVFRPVVGLGGRPLPSYAGLLGASGGVGDWVGIGCFRFWRCFRFASRSHFACPSSTGSGGYIWCLLSPIAINRVAFTYHLVQFSKIFSGCAAFELTIRPIGYAGSISKRAPEFDVVTTALQLTVALAHGFLGRLDTTSIPPIMAADVPSNKYTPVH